ncbi:MAG: efflux RND transporter periplasmic adaptor subunit [Gemmatimonadetes bacterium]|nr:efflux RND transporter periplasmic adaptor subunit [Gemmatimonadota bacterium]MCY3943255.1 efflux RND transporter periplasmic adaptor subunit [Gemmatimonadota bacterium]
MRTRNKLIIGVGAAVVLTAAAYFSLQGGRQGGVGARIEVVEARDLTETVTASGNVRARRKVDISSDISARVTELLTDEGEEVVEGQVLLRLDPTRYRAAVNRSMATLKQTQAQVAQVRANHLRAEREANRRRSLWQTDSLLVSRQEVENAESDLEVQASLLESAEFGVGQAEAALEEAEDQLAKTIIRAPMSGRVTRLNVEEGETVIVGTMNNPGSLVLTVSDLSVMEVVLEVDETDVPDISIGDSAMVELDAFPELDFGGEVTEIGNSAIRPPSQVGGAGQTPTIDFEVVVTLRSPPAELRPDLSATAQVVVESREDQLSIPIISLTLREEEDVEREAADSAGEAADSASEEEAKDDAGREGPSEPVEGVFVVREGLAHFVPVEVGIAGEEHFEVLSGVALGDTVVSGPYQVVRTLRSGTPIEPIRDAFDAGPGAG